MMFGRFLNWFGMANSKTIRIVREYGPDGKVIREVIDGTGQNGAELDETARWADQKFTKMDEFLGDMSKAFNKLFE